MTATQLLDKVREFSPEKPLRTLWRSTGYKLRPPRPVPFVPSVDSRQRRLIESGRARPDQRADVFCEIRPGPVPSIVLGGFVPDATESIYLQRGMLLRHGSIYYFNYAPDGFSTELVFAQLEDLVEELGNLHGTKPVVFGISFGCGLILEWMRHSRRTDHSLEIRGVILVSPVSCSGDVVEPRPAKPNTLLGRALQPFLDESGIPPAERHIEKSRTLLLRMFESGARNGRAIRILLTCGELLHIRHRVMATLKAVTLRGAIERVRALAAMEAPGGYYTEMLTPLTEAPVLILFAEKETSMLVETAPTLHSLAIRSREYFPSCQVREVANRSGSPVQHASLLFHNFNFSPPIATFYRRLRTHVSIERGGRLREAATWLRTGIARRWPIATRAA